jgi:hypothetical protein
MFRHQDAFDTALLHFLILYIRQIRVLFARQGEHDKSGDRHVDIQGRVTPYRFANQLLASLLAMTGADPSSACVSSCLLSSFFRPQFSLSPLFSVTSVAFLVLAIFSSRSLRLGGFPLITNIG